MNYPFARVLVIGCPGSGKSTFARRLHELTALPLCHLDLLFWNADKTTCTKEEFSAKLEEVLQTEAWIMDGNYSRTMERRLQCADAVFFFDLPTETCLDGVRKRRHQPRPDMPWVETEEDAEFMEFIRTFAQLRKPEIQKLLAGAPHVPVITFSSHKEADAYLEACRIL